MELVRKYAWSSEMFTTRAAVERACEGNGDPYNELKGLRKSQRATAKLVGRLVEILQKKGALTDEEVLNGVLDGTFAVPDEEDKEAASMKPSREWCSGMPAAAQKLERTHSS